MMFFHSRAFQVESSPCEHFFDLSLGFQVQVGPDSVICTESELQYRVNNRGDPNLIWRQECHMVPPVALRVPSSELVLDAAARRGTCVTERTALNHFVIMQLRLNLLQEGYSNRL